MITTAEATDAIADALPAFDSEAVELGQASGRILHQAVCAERDQPPFDRVTMDGIAVSYASFAAGNRRFPIDGTQHAGDAVQTLSNTDHCIEIMTGSVRPQKTDCIIPVERIAIENGVAILEADYVAKQNQFIHPQGSDHRQGYEVLSSGHRIQPADIAIIASCGLATVQVAKQPVVRVISTGNELIAAGQSIESHQIRSSNGPTLVAMLLAEGFKDTTHDHLVDEPEVLRERISEHLDQADILVLSGGVSMGKADFVPQVLEELGVDVVFHKISQRPGKPMWFGIGPNRQVVFALPGNPVSTLVCCRQYVLPALLAAGGRKITHAESAVLAEAVTFKPQLTCFLPVRLIPSANGQRSAMPVATNTSGDFAALSGTDGYVELVLEEQEFPEGTVVPLHRWSNP